jgi:adenine/guanine phosphoribosyltransferase-like PRPP-binding protein
MLHEFTSPESRIHRLRTSIAERITGSAKVIDPDSAYIFMPDINHDLSPYFLLGAAQVIKLDFVDHLPPEKRPNKVIGVPDRGGPLAAYVGLVLNINVGVGTRELDGKDPELSPAEYDQSRDMMIIRRVRSFSKGDYYRHLLRAVRPGDNVLLIDDVSATGDALQTITDGLRFAGVNTVASAVLVAKDFPESTPIQTGHRDLLKKGEETFAVVRLTGYKDGKVTATINDLKVR